MRSASPSFCQSPPSTPAPPPVAYIKVSGGLFRDMMIHDFDMANFLMDAAPVSVSAVGSSIVDPAIGQAGDVDTAAVTLTYAAEWAAFVNAVNAGSALPVALADGVAVLAMAEAATLSARTKSPLTSPRF